MKVFVVGYSQTGKSTTVAPAISEEFGMPWVEAGGWARELTPRIDDETVEEHTTRMTTQALEVRAENPQVAIEYVRSELAHLDAIRRTVNSQRVAKGLEPHPEEWDCIIVGLRSASDFAELAGPEDIAVFLNWGTPLTEFERAGVREIRHRLTPDRTFTIPVWDDEQKQKLLAFVRAHRGFR